MKQLVHCTSARRCMLLIVVAFMTILVSPSKAAYFPNGDFLLSADMQKAGMIKFDAAAFVTCINDFPESLMYECEDETCVEIIGEGIRNNLPNTISIPDPGSVEIIYLEALFNDGAPSTVTFSSSAGQSVSIPRRPLLGSCTGYSYRACFNPASSVTITAGNASEAEAFILYVIRSGGACTGQTSSGTFTETCIFRDTLDFTLDIPVTNTDKDIKVEVPLSELTEDGRPAIVEITACGVTNSTTVTGSDPALGSSLNIVDVMLSGVPGSCTEVMVEVQSPSNPTGQSLYVSGIVATFVSCDVCEIEVDQFAESACNDNGTPNDPSDDYFTIEIEASNNVPGPSNQYEVVYNGQVLATGNYGSSVTVGNPPNPPFAADGVSTYEIIIRDKDEPTCEKRRTTQPVECDLPHFELHKSISSIVNTSDRNFTVQYDIQVRNNGDGNGVYDLADEADFDDDINILSASYTSNAPGNPGGALNNSGNWALADDQSINGNTIHTYTLTVQVSINLEGGGGDDHYSECGEASQGNPMKGEGLYNNALLDLDDDGNAELEDDACGDLPYVIHNKTVSSVSQTGARTFDVTYKINVDNLGGAQGSYNLDDAPDFDDDIAITGASYTSTAPGNGGGVLNGSGPWNLASDQSIGGGANHMYNVTVSVEIDLSAGSGGDNVYTACEDGTPGNPRGGEGLYNKSELDIDDDGNPDEEDEACDDIPYVVHEKTVQSVSQTGSNTFRVVYEIEVENLGGVTGSYNLQDAPDFDDDLSITSASYSSTAPGNGGGVLNGNGPWTLASDQSITAGGTHTYTLTVDVELDLSTGSGGDNEYTPCEDDTPGTPKAGEGLYNKSLLDVDDDGNPDEEDEVCDDIPALSHEKTLTNISQTGPREYVVTYEIEVNNDGGVSGQYDLMDAPAFDDDIEIISTNYSTTAPGNPGGSLPGVGPWTLADDQNIASKASHLYTLNVTVEIDLSAGSGGNNIYTACESRVTGDPEAGEGLFNESRLDKNNDGIVDEVDEDCGDLPYVVHTKTVSSVSQTGARTFDVTYKINVDNLGGAQGSYNLDDAPDFDDDIAITGASYTSTAPGNGGGALNGSGPWNLASDQSIGGGANHMYNVTVSVEIDLSAGSGGDNVYTACEDGTPGNPRGGEGLYNKSELDIDDDGNPDEEDEACDDIPYVVHEKTVQSVSQTGSNTFRVVYEIEVENLGGVTGSYNLQDAPDFDDDLSITSASYSSTAPGNGGGVLNGNGPWTLASDQSITAGGTHTYTLTVDVELDLSTGSGGDNEYTPCEDDTPGTPKAGEGLYNKSLLDVDDDGNPDEEDEVCDDIPALSHEKTLTNISQTGPREYVVTYEIEVNNDGGVSGQYDLMDAPAFDDDIEIISTNYSTTAPGNPGGSLPGVGPWTLADDQNIASKASHLYTLNVTVEIDLSAGSGGNNIYTACESRVTGDPEAGEGLFNESRLDKNNDGIVDEVDEDCGDLPYVVHDKTVSSVNQTGARTFDVTYKINVDNLGGAQGSYNLDDAPDFDDDIAITGASYTSTAPGNGGGALNGNGPWNLASDQAIGGGANHMYNVTVSVEIDLSTGSGGDNVYTACEEGTPGNPRGGEGLYNKSELDIDDDGNPDEEDEACDDIPYVVHEKTVSGFTSLPDGSFEVEYEIVVRNIGGANGEYNLNDEPSYDDDVEIISASFNSTVGLNGGLPNVPPAGGWVLAQDQSIAAGQQHTYTLTVKVEVDLSPGSGGDNVITNCEEMIPGTPQEGEGLFNRSLLDVDDDGNPDEEDIACQDLPKITHTKTLSSVVANPDGSFTANYQVEVKNNGPVSGYYDLRDMPLFDDDVIIVSAEYSSTVHGLTVLAAAPPAGGWLLGDDVNIDAGATQTYSLSVIVEMDLNDVNTPGNGDYLACGETDPGSPQANEGLFNESRLDLNNDGTPDEIDDACGDIPFVTHNKTFSSSQKIAPSTYLVRYAVVVTNKGGATGVYDLWDQPDFEDDFVILSASYSSDAPGNPGGSLNGTGPWTLADDTQIPADGVHIYTLDVTVEIDLDDASSPGDEIYHPCGFDDPDQPKGGEGLFNESFLDRNNDGTPEEVRDACGDVEIFDLALKKRILNEDPIGPGQDAPFVITVFNQGNLEARNIMIVDYLNRGFLFNSGDNPGWSQVGNEVRYTIPSLAANDSINVFLDLEIQVAVNPVIEDWNNYAEVMMSDALGFDGNVISKPQDDDSTPGSDSPDERSVLPGDPDDDNIFGDSKNAGEDEDDHDPSKAIVTGSIGDKVFNDKDGDGIQDPGDPGVPGVILSLFTCEGEFVDSDTTDANGNYLFDLLIPFESYFIVVDKTTIGSNFAFADANAGNNDALDSDVNLSGVGPCYQVNPGEDYKDYDAGIVELAKVGDFVFEDINGNGRQDPDDKPIADVIVNLYDLDDNLIDSDTTDANGNYLIENVRPGAYYVEFIYPNTFDVTDPNVGDDEGDSDLDGTNGQNTTGTINLSPGEVDLTVDLGLYACIEIGDFVWFDLNANGRQDAPENGINGVRVFLKDENGMVVMDQKTRRNPHRYSMDGYFKFCVRPGTYYLLIERPGHLAVSDPFVGTDSEKDSDIDNSIEFYSSGFFTVSSGDMRCDLDAGFHWKATMGDRVWFDENQNGIQDNGEARIAGVTISAYDRDGTMFWQDVSNNEGEFYMDGLSGGDYYLKFDPPAGYTFTYPDAGDDDGSDSDVDGSNGPRTTALYRVNPGEHEPDVDAGLIQGFLPIELVDFKATYVGDKVQIRWTTAVEINNEVFVIERRHESEGKFSAIGQVRAAGTVYTSQDYSYDDYEVSRSGTYFYRLRQIDTDGSEAQSHIEAVEVYGNGHGLHIYPNPASDVLNLELNTGSIESVDCELVVIDALGRMITSTLLQATIEGGYSEEQLVLDKLQPGIYTLKVKMGDEVIRRSFTKL